MVKTSIVMTEIKKRTQVISLLNYPELDSSSIAYAYLGRHTGTPEQPEKGYSLPPYHSMNMSFRLGDTPGDVRHNYCMLKKSLGTRLIRVITLEDPNDGRWILYTARKKTDRITSDRNPKQPTG